MFIFGAFTFRWDSEESEWERWGVGLEMTTVEIQPGVPVGPVHGWDAGASTFFKNLEAGTSWAHKYIYKRHNRSITYNISGVESVSQCPKI